MLGLAGCCKHAVEPLPSEGPPDTKENRADASW